MTSAPRTLFLIAAELEAELLFGPAERRASALDICVAGVGTKGDAAALEAIASTQATVVVNPGFAGGLSEATRPGRCFAVTEWIGPERTSARGDLPPSLVEGLAPLLAGSAIAATVDAPVGDSESRRRLADAGADLVEMEGARWAAAADSRGLPFVSLRVISDCANNALPRPRHELLTTTGQVRWRRWFRAAAASEHGWQESLARLRRAQRDWRLACKSLRAVGTALVDWQRTATESQTPTARSS